MGRVAAYDDAGTGDTPLCGVLSRLFAPLARLCLTNGMLYGEAEELLKRSFVEAAQALQPDLPQHGTVSRVAAATGLNRREVTRLVQERSPRRKPKVSLASEVIARWTALPLYRGEDGTPLPLPRLGEAPSFESLARSISQDLHPRSMLEELLRLGIIRLDEASDQVILTCSEHVPGSRQEELLGFLSDNIGDHLESGVANIVKSGIEHHDQAIFADELSEDSVQALAPLIMQHWHSLRDGLVPVISEMIEADRAAGRPQDRRIRVGMYSFSEAEKELQA